MKHKRERIHEPTGIDKRHFSSLIIDAPPFRYARIKQGGYGLLKDDFWLKRIANRGFHVFVLTLSGNGVITLEDGTTLYQTAGDVFISWSTGQGHFEKTLENELWEMVWFSVWDTSKSYKPLSNDYTMLRMNNTEITSIRSVALELFQEEMIYDSKTNESIALYENLFLIYMERILSTNDRENVNSRHKDSLNRLWEIVNHNQERPWSIKELVATSGYSRSHLSRLCMELYGKSPAQMVREKKMNLAEVYLRNSSEKITQISYKLGYSSPSVFSMAFKNYFGITPKEFRNTDSNRISAFFSHKLSTFGYEKISEGIPVLIIPELGFTKSSMKTFLEPIFSKIKGFRRFYVDLPGCGETARGEIANGDDTLELLACFARIIIDEPFIVIAHGYGAYLAECLMKIMPDAIYSTIMIAPSNPQKLGKIPKANHKIELGIDKDKAKKYTSYLNVISRETMALYDRTIESDRTKCDQEFISQLKANLVVKNIFADRVFDGNVLILLGRQDEVSGFSQYIDQDSNYPHKTVAISDVAGHIIEIDDQYFIQENIIKWLTKTQKNIRTAIRNSTY